MARFVPSSPASKELCICAGAEDCSTNFQRSGWHSEYAGPNFWSSCWGANWGAPRLLFFWSLFAWHLLFAVFAHFCVWLRHEAACQSHLTGVCSWPFSYTCCANACKPATLCVGYGISINLLLLCVGACMVPPTRSVGGSI